ncbi:YceI family protein [Parenemella sanctibonifatiensis]|uniref:Polyisoprenoid-binding protein n=1 Tax=Parenemella sanctibonifatiensis TaxID=2016505 RepID=A0A255EEM8_9ACTN|nr:YceI family protein [Parenemella sanctibonifatiensis]OYN89381.1 polyisoprenoid-binding protein [Parenemella sanctibonifatiensis]
MTDLTTIAGTYVIDPSHSELSFTARHAMVTKVRGTFNDISGTATTEANLQNARIEVKVGVESINTRSADRDGHLKSADFFDVAQYPNITFVSTDVQGSGDTLTVTGNLTIKDVTKPVTIDFEVSGPATDPFGNERIGAEGAIEVNRKDFGLTWNAALETGGVLVSEKVKLAFDVSLIKQA